MKKGEDVKVDGSELLGKGKNSSKHTPKAKYRVRPIDPKYAAVNGNRGVDRRCIAYVRGP